MPTARKGNGKTPHAEHKKYWDYLDKLREKGTDMFRAAPDLQKQFPELTEDDARAILMEWFQHYLKHPPK